MKISHLLLILLLLIFVGCKADKGSQDLASEQAPAEETAEQAEGGEAGYESGTWITDFPQALEYAKELERPVLINFTGSDWCSWCIKLNKEVFTQEAFLNYAKANLVLVKIDFPSKIQLPPAVKKANDALAGEFDVKGYPTIVLTDNTGKEIQRTGYQPGGAEKYVQHLQGLLNAK